MTRIAAVVTILICGLFAGQALAADPDRPPIPPPTDFWQNKGFMNMAHQGGELEAPGNTLYAFKTAVRYRGADVLEMDSYVSADGVLMVTHDMRPSGTSNAPGSADLEIRKLTLEQLKTYDFAWKFTPGKGHYGFDEADPHPFRGIATGDKPPPTGYTANDFRIATFEEVIEAFPDTPLNIDMKDSGQDPSVSLAAAEALAEIMNAHPERSEDVIVASFDQAALERFHELAPNHKALSGSLDGTVPYAFGGPISPAPVAIQPPDLFEFGSVVRTVPLLKPFTSYDGFALHVWGSDRDPEQETDPFYARLIEEGADGFFTQMPSKLHQYLCETGIRRPDGSQRCSLQAPDVAPVLRLYSFRGARALVAGQRTSFTILLGNTGNTEMSEATACLTVPKASSRTVRGSCARSKAVSPGDLATLNVSLNATARAKGKVRISLIVTSDGGERTVTETFRILPSGSCSKKGGSKGGSTGGMLCGSTNHF
ncbi:MAG: glycerophosphodiester phosphodiesterase family protein [Solirubrobacterales bacterium]